MSNWVHVLGAIDLDISNPKVLEDILGYRKKLSEKGYTIFVNKTSMLTGAYTHDGVTIDEHDNFLITIALHAHLDTKTVKEDMKGLMKIIRNCIIRGKNIDIQMG